MIERIEALSDANGKTKANALVIFCEENGDEILYLQSYESVVIRYNPAREYMTVGPDWDFSKTTMKHVRMFVDKYIPHLKDASIKDIRDRLNRKDKVFYDGKLKL